MVNYGLIYKVVFFFKQKTAYEMRISDWSSDVCSSDLVDAGGRGASQIQFLRRDVGQRIEEDVDDAAGAVAQGGGAEDRQHEVEALAGAVGSTGLAEVLRVIGEAGVGGDVEPAEQRAEERRAGKEGVSTCKTRWGP